MTVDVHVEVDDEFQAEVAVQLVEDAARAALADQGAAGVVTVVITDDANVQELNHAYRGIDAPTDVLSFAARESADIAPALTLPPELSAELEANLGDLIISFPYAARQALHYGNSADTELRLLVVHGVLHLLGYDHATAAEEQAMWAVQRRILAQFGDDVVVDRTYQI